MKMHKFSKTTEAKCSKLLVLSIAFALTSSLFAKTTTFIGQPGMEGGDKFSVAENWDNGLPVAGDTLIVSSKVVSVVNDLKNLTVKHLYLYKNAEVDSSPTLSGNALDIEDGGSLRPYSSSVIYNEISCAGKLDLGVNGSSANDVRLYGSVTVAGTLNPKMKGNIYAYAPIRAGVLTGTTGVQCMLHLCSTGNSFGTCTLTYANLYTEVANAIDPEFVIDWGTAYFEDKRSKYSFGAHDQTANRIVGPFRNSSGGEISNCRQIEGTGTLTLNGTADAITPCLIESSLSVVWNPSGNFTQTFSNRVHTTTGSLTVSNGTMRLAAGGSFKNVKTITVAPGATFDLATPTASTLSGLTTLTVDGTFRFADAAANPFGSSSLVAKIGVGGKLHVPSEVTITIPKVCVKGVWQGATSYSGEDWIEGGGTVTVTSDLNASSWKAAVDGAWSDGTKWFDGSAPSAKPAYVTAEGADYDVTFDEATFSVPEVHVGNDAEHTTRLLVSGDKSLASNDSTKFDVSDNGVVEIASGLVALTNLNNNSTLATVSGKGVWRVSGGTNSFYSAGKGINLMNGGTLQITGGRFSTRHRINYGNSFTMQNGNLVVSGTGQFRNENDQGESNMMGSGTITATGNGSLYYGRAYRCGPATASGTLRVTLDDSASMSANVALGFGNPGGETYVSLHGNSRLNLGQLGMVGINTTGLVKMDVYDGATVSNNCYGCYIGSLENTKNNNTTCFPTGIVNVVGGEFFSSAIFYDRNDSMNGVDTYQGVIIGGTYSTIVTVNNVRQQFTNPYRLHGEMNVFANGTYKQGMGYLAVGMADADGIMRIAGGTALKDAEFMKTAAVHGEPNGEILIGVCGGNGLVEVTGGGTVDFKGKLFAGGVDPAGLRVPRTWSSLNTASTASTGTVRVVDGTFAVSGAMTLGARGTGILEVGSNGVVNASSLVMSNNVESVLSFKFGPDGIGCVNLVGGLEITPGAKLKVDASEYTGTESRRFPLVLADSVSGSFASVEYDNRKLRMTFREDGLYATVNPAGFVLVVR